MICKRGLVGRRQARCWKYRGSLSQCPVPSPHFTGAKGQFYGGGSQVHIPTSCHCFYGCRTHCSGGGGSNLLTPESRLRGCALELKHSGGSLRIPHFPGWNGGVEQRPWHASPSRRPGLESAPPGLPTWSQLLTACIESRSAQH